MAFQRVGGAGLHFVIPRANVLLGRSASRPLLLSKASLTLARCISTEKVAQKDYHSILVAQRLKRPVSPHLTVYKLEQTWFGSSIWMRFTGIGLSGACYGYFIAYLAAPMFGWHIDSVSTVGAFAALSPLAQGGIKFGLSFPFVFHFINGLKHFVYDAGFGYDKKTIKYADYFQWSSSALGAVVLAFLF